MTNNGKNGAISSGQLEMFRKNFNAMPLNKVLLNAATRSNIQDVALNRDILNDADFTFSHEIESGEINDQKRSGTCWLYAELNWLRTYTQKKYKIKNVTFSENYIIFWDKFEKANYFLENMIALRDVDLDDRELQYLLQNPCSDGGDWHMIVNLIKKYGLLPRSAMPDTANRENTRYLNELVTYKEREALAKIRTAHAAGANEAVLRAIKDEYMEIIYRFLAIMLGLPPQKIDFAFKDDDKKFHRETGITPLEFYEKFVGINLDEVYSLWSAPTIQTPYKRPYRVKYFTNMVGAEDWKCLNLPIDDLKSIAVKMIKNEEAVLFGCDVLQDSNTKEGLLHTDVYDYDLFFQTDFTLDKAARVDYAQSRMTHSMVFLGVDLVDDVPLKWKVENSWGDKVGKKGYFVMSDKWFDEHVFDMVVPKKYLKKKTLDLFEKDVVEMPPWYPMT